MEPPFPSIFACLICFCVIRFIRNSRSPVPAPHGIIYQMKPFLYVAILFSVNYWLIWHWPQLSINYTGVVVFYMILYFAFLKVHRYHRGLSSIFVKIGWICSEQQTGSKVPSNRCAICKMTLTKVCMRLKCPIHFTQVKITENRKKVSFIDADKKSNRFHSKYIKLLSYSRQWRIEICQ